MEIDQQLKERLVGATVLIVAGIVIIPLLLDGPQTSQPVRVGLELPAAQTDRQTHTIRLDVPASQPASPASGSIDRPTPEAQRPVPRPAESLPAAGPPPDATQETAAATSPSEPVKETVATAGTSEAPVPRPAETPVQREPAEKPDTTPKVSGAASSPSTTGGWAVQIGSFSQMSNVERVEEQLRSAGFESFSTQVVSGGRTLHRVRVGPVTDRSAAEALARRLDAAGFAGRVVSNED